MARGHHPSFSDEAERRSENPAAPKAIFKRAPRPLLSPYGRRWVLRSAPLRGWPENDGRGWTAFQRLWSPCAMDERRPFIATYIMASGRNGTLYVGVTSDLYRRVWEHRTGRYGGFSDEHGCGRLVWFEQHETMATAIQREKRLKHWLRNWKLALIERDNPAWDDLASAWFGV